MGESLGGGVPGVKTPVKIAQVASDDLALRYLLLGQLRDLVESDEYEVVAISTDGPEIPFLQSVGVRHIPVPMTRRPVTPFSDLVSLFRLIRVMHRERFTVVHTHTTKAGFLGRWAALLTRVPVIVHTNHGFVFHERSGSFWRRWFIALEKLAAASCDLILCVSAEDVATAERLRIGRGKVELLGQGGIGVDCQVFNPPTFSPEMRAGKRAELGLAPDAPVVGFVGRLTIEKGVLELFVASKLVHKEMSEVRFLVIGVVDAARSDAVGLDVAIEFGVDAFTSFLGLRQDMPELYSVMDVFVLPSYREGLPRVLMEASAMALPSVGTDVRGSREVIEDGVTGLLVPPKDPVALAAAILDLLRDRERATKMSQAARERALQSFDERPVFERIRGEYRRLIQDKVRTDAL